MATIVPAQQTAIANLYVALFNRAPDAAGFGFWVQSLSNGASLASITSAFLGSPESRAIYPASQTSEQFITSFYTTVFGRTPDAAGLAFWAGVVNANGGSSSDAAKAVAVAQIVALVSTPLTTKPADITDAQFAQTVADRATFANKVEVGTYYAVDAKGTSVDTAKQVISGVNNTAASVTAAKAIADSATNVGSTFTGTTGADSFTGTGANDTFNFLVDNDATKSTLSAIDKVAGGAGIDTLNVTTVGIVADVLNAADVSGIETIAIRATTSGTLSTLTAAPTGVTTISVSGAGSVNAGTVTGLAAGTKFALNGVAGTGNYSAVYAATATTANISLSGGNTTSGSIGVSGTGLTSVTVTGSNGTNSVASMQLATGVKNVTIDAQSALTTGTISNVGADTAITVTGAGVASIGTLFGNVATVTATANTGGLTATLGAGTQKIAGSAGVDTISTGIALTTGSVDGGAGTGDILVVTNSNALNSAALGAKYTNFEILRVNDGVTVDLDNIAGITAVRVADGAGATGVTNLTAAQAAAVSILTANPAGGAITLGVKGATNGGQIDTVKASVATTGGTAANLTGIVLAGVEKLELTGTGTVASNTGLITLDTAGATSLDSIIVKNLGGASITVSGTHAASNLSIDASGSAGAVTVDASAYATSTGATIKGGSGTNTLIGSASADTIVGGAGNDILVGDGTYNATAKAETQSIAFSGTATASDTYALGGYNYTVTNGDTAATIGANIATGGANNVAFLAANTTVDTITYAAGAFAITYKATAGDVANITANLGTTGLTGATTATEGTKGALAGSVSAATGASADTLTGGAGNDTFAFAQNGSIVTAFDTITDLNLGTNVAGGKVDTLLFQNTGATATVVTLTDAQQLVVTNAATLADAVTAVLAVAGADGATATFTRGGDTFLIHNGDGNATFNDAADFLVKITGFTGVLDVSDITIV